MGPGLCGPERRQDVRVGKGDQPVPGETQRGKMNINPLTNYQSIIYLYNVYCI